jgi:hypothetical protein
MFYFRNVSPVQYKTVTLTVAQIRSLSVVPVELIAAPAANQIIRVIWIQTHLVVLSTPYTAANLDLVYYQQNISTTYLIQSIQNLLDDIANFSVNNITNSLAAPDSKVIGRSVVAIAETNPGALGDSTVTFYLRYEIISYS